MAAVAIANDLACKGLDRIEKTLPLLHRPPEQVCPGSTMTLSNFRFRLKVPSSVSAQIVSSAKDVVTTARDAVSGTVSSAKDSVSDTLGTAVERTRGAVQGGMERTRVVVSGGIDTILESRVVRLVSVGLDAALSTSESLVDQYLPVTEDELGGSEDRFRVLMFWLNSLFSSELEAQTVKGFDAAAPTYYVRLECLSTRLRKRTYNSAVSKIQEARRRSRGLMTELQSPADLVSPHGSEDPSAQQVLIPRDPFAPDPVWQEEHPGGQPEAQLSVEGWRSKHRNGPRRRGNDHPAPVSDVVSGS